MRLEGDADGTFELDDTNPCCQRFCCGAAQSDGVPEELPHSPGGTPVTKSPVPLSGAFLASADEIGSNEDEWEVETLPEIDFNELGGEQ